MNCPYCGVHIDEHPASRCLDKWIAQVFGVYDKICQEEYHLMLPEGAHLPYYSTNIAAVWEVEEKIEERKLRSRYSQALVAQMLDTVVNSDEHMWWLLAHASPHHRCRAAIKAVQA